MNKSTEVQRVSKLMAHRKMCSRREAEKLIDSGAVLVNGEVLKEQGVKVAVNSTISIIEEKDNLLSKQFAILFHKPDGIVSNLPQDEQKAAFELISEENLTGDIPKEKLEMILKDIPDYAVAGRLDRASRGALILTNNGRLVKAITGGNKIKKVYTVRVESDVNETMLKELNGVIHLAGDTLKPMVVKKINDRTLIFELIEGKKHQIRRVCRIVNLNVMSLFRTDVGVLSVLNLPEGNWRMITKEEIEVFIKT